ncbi:transketolase family protein [Streptomyces cyaneofuscatus]|uniref:transketolase family protein n=1 Tax=Streptomyces cyaneofuscatus TaxID=66883 RepID=UPI0037A18304
MNLQASTPPSAERPTPLEWTALDRRAVEVARALAVDAVEAAGHGHPGTAMSLAPAAYLLFQRLLRHDPADPQWAGRDRFVLSCGHSSLTLYTQLYLSGYGLRLGAIRALRTEGSLTPAHPEYGHTPGVETTTGPLGQVLGNAVGMAMAARRERGLFDPDAAPGQSPFDHTVWAFTSDGDLEGGIGHEASVLAGHQKLGNLVVLFDDNHISIEDDTRIARSEDVLARYRAYGWHVEQVDRTAADGYHEDVQALYAALDRARSTTDRPSLVALRTIIGRPAPNEQNSGRIHGAALGAAEAAAAKAAMGLDPGLHFQVPDEVLAHARQVTRRGHQARAQWEKRYADWRSAHPGRAASYDRISARRLPEGWEQHLPEFAPGQEMATGKAGLDIVRPADSGETVVAWRTVLENTDRPAGRCLSRQNLPVLDRSPATGLAPADGVARGGYILAEADGSRPDTVLVATGSEVQIALAARQILQKEGIATRVVSMPCLEWFQEQDRSYRDAVLPPGVRARVSVEAGTALGWYALLGEAGEAISIEQFGASAPYRSLYQQFGLTPDRVAAAARSSLRRTR